MLTFYFDFMELLEQCACIYWYDKDIVFQNRKVCTKMKKDCLSKFMDKKAHIPTDMDTTLEMGKKFF